MRKQGGNTLSVSPAVSKQQVISTFTEWADHNRIPGENRVSSEAMDEFASALLVVQHDMAYYPYADIKSIRQVFTGKARDYFQGTKRYGREHGSWEGWDTRSLPLITEAFRRLGYPLLHESVKNGGISVVKNEVNTAEIRAAIKDFIDNTMEGLSRIEDMLETLE